MKKTIIFLSCFFMINTTISANAINIKKEELKKIKESQLKDHKFKIKVAVIKKNGDIISCAKVLLIIEPFNRKEIEKQFEEKNNAEVKPSYDDETGYKKWEKIAHKGVKEYFDKIIKKRHLTKIVVIEKTNLNGELTLKLPNGEWFVNAHWSNSNSSIFWTSVKIDVNDELELFELSNDNSASIYNY